MNRALLILLFSFTLLITSCGNSSQNKEECIVKVENGKFIRNGKPFYYIGTNFWYGALLGSKGEGGDRERLNKELDFLKSQGITNLRVLVGGEGLKSYPSKISPILQPKAGEYNNELLDGLDYFMYQIGLRDMNAVLYLANAWEWSGGFIQYLQWAGDVDEDFDADNCTWSEYREAASKFVRSGKAMELLNNHIKYIVSRTNSYTGEKYINDPALFAWQLCNEPRAFSEESKEYLYKWVDKTSAIIRSLDPNHMISTGSEGRMGSEGDIKLFERIHSLENISYINAHMWSLNWKWIDSSDMDGTIDSAINKCNNYIQEHIIVANKLRKPLVFEEFGLPRDNAAIESGSSTIHRDSIYKIVFDKVVESAHSGGLFAGCNFWSWGGKAEQVQGQKYWKKGMDYCGDPPQEAQGLNSVYVDDESTLQIVRDAIKQLK